MAIFILASGWVRCSTCPKGVRLYVVGLSLLFALKLFLEFPIEWFRVIVYFVVCVVPFAVRLPFLVLLILLVGATTPRLVILQARLIV